MYKAVIKHSLLVFVCLCVHFDQACGRGIIYYLLVYGKHVGKINSLSQCPSGYMGFYLSLGGFYTPRGSGYKTLQATDKTPYTPRDVATTYNVTVSALVYLYFI